METIDTITPSDETGDAFSRIWKYGVRIALSSPSRFCDSDSRGVGIGAAGWAGGAHFTLSEIGARYQCRP